MFGGNIKLAIASLRRTKWRSLLTMLGIIIGIVSVITTVSLGEGVKQQVVGRIHRLGGDLITIRPGAPAPRGSKGTITGLNVAYGLGIGAGSLNERDIETVKQTAGVGETVPLSFITGTAISDNREYKQGYIFGTTADLPVILKQKVEFGNFFSAGDTSKQVAIIGKTVAEQLFQENIPVGRIMTIRGQDFVVRGIFESFDDTPLLLGADFNAAIFIPYDVGKQISPNSTQLVQIWAKPKDASKAKAVLDGINRNLLQSHNGGHDFTVLKQDDNLALTAKALNVFTGFIAGIAAISLLVGGIGIMNTMLLSVTERTREIGIRKAIGATNRQLLTQFLTEAMTLSLAGGVIGIVVAGIVNYVIRILTSFTPVITLPVIALASGVSVAVGIIFGVVPAARAGRKDPIEALRNE